MNELTGRHCKPCEGGTAPLDGSEAEQYMRQVHDDWTLWDDRRGISRTFRFRNYYHTTAFINAVAWIAHQEDHHPDISFGYNQAQVSYSTHAIGGLSENDFICAAKVDALLSE
ncbi:MAG TPA: 4a-hydroxytetrahydrobiopterin dehydratase [Gammaproteobacteria bacterium]|nr:4a-hydroxytetrahydrobiopterin dehydratase [Gammaproteobacteria bacterium]